MARAATSFDLKLRHLEVLEVSRALARESSSPSKSRRVSYTITTQGGVCSSSDQLLGCTAKMRMINPNTLAARRWVTREYQSKSYTSTRATPVMLFTPRTIAV